MTNISTNFSVKLGELKAINDASTQTDIEISKALYQTLLECKNLNALTFNKFNPAIYPLVKLWKFSPDNFVFNDQTFTPPSENEIANLLVNTDFSTLSLTEKNSKYYATKTTDIKIDLGAVAKGVAVEKLSELFSKYNYKDGYISLGTSAIKVFGENSVLLRNPRSNDIKTVLNIKLNDKAISTSGDYERYHIYNGKRYSHLIDSLTGYPTDTGIISATIISNDAVKADALTTALCTMTLQDAISFIKTNLSNETVFIIYENENGLTIYTNKTSGYTLTDNSVNLEII